MQLDVLVPQGNCGTRRTITVLGGFLPSLLSGIGQALADPGANASWKLSRAVIVGVGRCAPEAR